MSWHCPVSVSINKNLYTNTYCSLHGQRNGKINLTLAAIFHSWARQVFFKYKNMRIILIIGKF